MFIARQTKGSFVKLIPQGELPPTRTMRDLLPGLVVEQRDKPPQDEPLCDIAAREGAHIGGAATTDWAKGYSEEDWWHRKKNIQGDKHEIRKEEG